MKPDMDFLRDLLLQIEVGPKLFETASAEVAGSLGYVPEKPLTQGEADKLSGHLDWLEEKGLIDIEVRSAAGAYHVKGLTGRGREFLERELRQEVKPPSRKDEMPSRTDLPDIEWYLRISAEPDLGANLSGCSGGPVLMHAERNGLHRWFPVGLILRGPRTSSDATLRECDIFRFRRIHFVNADGSIRHQNVGWLPK
jgi:Hypothetical protein (DUF2513)